MKRTFTQAPIIPRGWTGRDFNNWNKYLYDQLEKLHGTRNILVKIKGAK